MSQKERSSHRNARRRGLPRTDPGLPEPGVPDVREVEEAIEEAPEADGDRGDILTDPLLAEITPLPWRINGSGTRILAGSDTGECFSDPGFPDNIIVADSDSKIADFLFNQPDKATRKANIWYIVRAVNSYEPLAKFCEAFVELFRSTDMAPEDECHELYGSAVEILQKIKENS